MTIESENVNQLEDEDKNSLGVSAESPRPAPDEAKLTLRFEVDVTATVSALRKHLGEPLSQELHQGGAIYLNDLVPEFDCESSEIKEIVFLVSNETRALAEDTFRRIERNNR